MLQTWAFLSMLCVSLEKICATFYCYHFTLVILGSLGKDL